MNNRTKLDNIIREWKQTSNSITTLSALKHETDHAKRQTYNLCLDLASQEADRGHTHKLMELLYDLAIHQNTDPNELIALLAIKMPASDRNIGHLVSSQHDWTSRDYFINIVKELVLRNNVDYTALLTLLQERYKHSNLGSNITQESTLLTDLINTHDVPGIMHYIDIILSIHSRYPLNDEQIVAAIDVVGGKKNVGEMIAHEITTPNCMIALCYLLGQLQATDYRAYLPSNYNSFTNFVTKEEMVKYIESMNPKHKRVFAEHAVDEHHPLGHIMYMKRGVKACRPEKGQLKKLHQLLSKLEANNSPARLFSRSADNNNNAPSEQHDNAQDNELRNTP